MEINETHASSKKAKAILKEMDSFVTYMQKGGKECSTVHLTQTQADTLQKSLNANKKLAHLDLKVGDCTFRGARIHIIKN